ncbi:MAG: glycosyltransferase family 2 protein [Catenulispora sp.]|nr:glycosyltransferase family 2 protein [Catenulispora sp.]
MTDPELTVIVPTRERPGLLKETVDSITTSARAASDTLGATVRVLVVDDASPTDSTRDLVAQLRTEAAAAGTAVSVDYARVEEHDGRKDPGAAIALGVSLATSRYLTIFGDDDIMLPPHITTHLRNMRRGADVSAASYYITDGDLNRQYAKRRRAAHLGDLLIGRIDVNDGAFVRTDLIQAMELDPALLAQMLYPVWATLLIDGRKFVYSRTPTFLYRRHDANISSANKDDTDAALRKSLQEKYQALAAERLGAVPDPRKIDWARHKREWRYSKKGYVRWRMAATELAVKRNPAVRKAFRMPPLPPKES